MKSQGFHPSHVSGDFVGNKKVYQWRPSGDLQLSYLPTLMRTSLLRYQWMKSKKLHFLPATENNAEVVL